MYYYFGISIKHKTKVTNGCEKDISHIMEQLNNLTFKFPNVLSNLPIEVPKVYSDPIPDSPS